MTADNQTSVAPRSAPPAPLDVVCSVFDALERIEEKLDALTAELDEFRPLLEKARARYGGRRWGGKTDAPGN